MFGQEVQRFCGSLQILDGCPVFVASALLSFEIVLDVDEQAGLPGALLRLAGVTVLVISAPGARVLVPAVPAAQAAALAYALAEDAPCR